MKTRRWIDRLIAETETCKFRLPWERGLRRQAMIVRRGSATPAPQPRHVALGDTRISA